LKHTLYQIFTVLILLLFGLNLTMNTRNMVKEKMEQTESEKSDSTNEGDENYLTEHFCFSLKIENKTSSSYLHQLSTVLPDCIENLPEIPPPNSL
jgi:hypothetical protein